MSRRLLLAAALLLLLGSGVGWYLMRPAPLPPPPIERVVQGGDGGALPRATPADENFAPAALAEAGARALQEGAQAFLVLRHGHLVAESYATGFDRDTRADAGAFAATLVAMNIGVAITEGLMRANNLQGFQAERLAAILASEADMPYEEYLSTRVWRRLNAADASFQLPRPGAAIRAGCCLVARLGDWMRVAVLLLEDGHFQGEAVLPTGWVARMRQPQLGNRQQGMGILLGDAAVGAEPFADDVFFVRGKGRWRLWLAPTLQLAVLHVGDGGSENWDETALPNAVIRAVMDRPAPAVGTPLQQLVPGH